MRSDRTKQICLWIIYIYIYWTDESIDEKLTITEWRWLCLYAILTFCICSVTNIVFSYTNIGNCTIYIYIYIYNLTQSYWRGAKWRLIVFPKQRCSKGTIDRWIDLNCMAVCLFQSVCLFLSLSLSLSRLPTLIPASSISIVNALSVIKEQS